MLFTLFLTLYILIGFVGSVLIIIFALCFMLADFLGAPYVPTKGKLLKEILDKAKLKKGQLFVELGSGDGRILRAASGNYGVKAVGYELNIVVYYISRMINRIKGYKNITLKMQNFFNADLSKADVIFAFLLPRSMKKLGVKFQKECKKGTLIISHGFAIKGMEDKLIDKTVRDPFSTYYYRI